MMRETRAWWALGMLLLTAGCAAGAGGRQPAAGEAPPEESRRLSRFVHIEEGRDLMITVGVRAAAFHEADAFFPLELSLTNRGSGVTWVVTRESFTLFDAEGRAYGMPTQTELLAGYDKRTFDSRLFESRSVTASKLEGFRQVESSFFPDPVRGVRRTPDTVSGAAGVAPTSSSLVPFERVEVTPMTFMEDVLYFPHPEGPLTGALFSLEVRAQGLVEPARIAFRIPHIK